MKKLLLFVLTLACFASFAEESRLERRLKIINERLDEEQKTIEHQEAKKALVNSKEVKQISCYKFTSNGAFICTPVFVVTNNMFCYISPEKYELNGFNRNSWLPKKINRR